MIIENTQRQYAEQQASLDLAWGAREIARLIGKTPRATFHLLEQGHIPAARKVGNQWVVSRIKLREQFERMGVN